MSALFYFCALFLGNDTVNVIFLPSKYMGVLLHSFESVRAFQVKSDFGSVGFEERGNLEYPEKNLSII